MRRCSTVLFGLAAVFLMSVTQSHAQRRVALIVGNGAYQAVPKLFNPVNDANSVAALFKQAGFDVVEGRNDLGSLELKRAVRDFTNVAREADVAVVYFAGHGIEIGGTNYLIPVDARLKSDFDAEDEALSLDRVVRALEPARRLRLVILDACRDNPFLTTMRRSIASRAVTGGLAKVEPATTDTLIAFAAKAGSTAADGAGDHSPFTAALLKHIAAPGLDVRIAFGRVRDEVMKATVGKQEPFVYGSLGGSTVALVSEPEKPAAAKAAPAKADERADVRRDYELAERVGTREAWDSFLAVHGAGFYADLARAQRTKLAAVEPPKSANSPPPSAEAEKPAPRAAKPQIAVLAPGEADKPTPPDIAGEELSRQLQVELKRVGCDPGAVDGDWGARSRRALALFNEHAGTRLDANAASLDALGAVRGKTGRVCPLSCGPGFRLEGESCVAEPASPPARPLRRAIIERLRQGPPAVAPRPRGPSSSNCQSPITVGGRQCCTYDVPGMAPRVICQ